MNFFKFIFKVIVIILMIIGAIYGHYYMTDLKVRKELKEECFSENCPCFYNIVDYRLTKNQVKSFLLYLKNRKVRPETKIMEFTNFDDAKQIMEMFSVCQLGQVKIQQEEKQPKIQENETEEESNQEEQGEEV